MIHAVLLVVIEKINRLCFLYTGTRRASKISGAKSRLFGLVLHSKAIASSSYVNDLLASALPCFCTSQICNLLHQVKFLFFLVSTHGCSQNQIIYWKYLTISKLTEHVCPFCVVQNATLTCHTYQVMYVAVSPDGQTIEMNLKVLECLPVHESPGKTNQLIVHQRNDIFVSICKARHCGRVRIACLADFEIYIGLINVI
ncbi:hypothetical protein HID58_046911 [Brassica napus]|uniref:Uncharacterized protein n=1 Tax=Brassica napus TaxID=3708 RepID=A0ABQ8AXX1_BRANA|nr:hypothetical protein HID58_046911 [Brassica napus]